MYYYIAMKIANIAELKNRLSEFLSHVERGEAIEVRKRNIPIARVVPIPKVPPNRTVLGCGLNTVAVQGDLTQPFIEESSWDGLG